MLVVIGIVAILSLLTFANYKSGGSQLALQRSANKIARDIRGAQEMAMSSREFAGQVPSGGYGLFFWKDTAGGIDYPHKYVLFADLNGNHYRSGAEDVEWFMLEKGVKFSKFYLDGDEVSGSSFTFIPPDPTTCINDCTNNFTKIVISLENDSSATKTIILNEAGLIYVE